MWTINILGLLLILAIVWWFWLYRPADAASAQSGVINIIVENGVYAPARIEVPVDEPVTLRFLRKDASPCAGTVVFSDFEISEELPVDKPRDIVLTPHETGNFAFTCQMQMYRGELRVTGKT